MQKEFTIIINIFLILLLIDVNLVSITNECPKQDFKKINFKLDYNQFEENISFKNHLNINSFFTENCGQINNDSVKYYLQGKGIWFLNNSIVFKIDEPFKRSNFRKQFMDLKPLDKFKDDFNELNYRKSYVLKLNFENANRIVPKGNGLLSHRSNFFYGNNSVKWCINVPNYQEIIYENIYDNIDLRYYTTAKGLKYDFIVHPKGEVNDIRLKYEGAKNLWIDNSDNLRINTPFGDIVDTDPFIYQDLKNDNKVIDGKFRIISPLTYGFEVSDIFDRNTALIIDPLVYSTFIGGNNDDLGYDIELDPTGHAYIAGWTESNNFPNTTGAFDIRFNINRDVFVLKLNPSGSALIYSTYVGGSGMDQGNDMEIDSNGNSYVTGFTGSVDFPNTTEVYDNEYNDGGSDVFVFKLNQDGSALIYSTFIGGNNWDWGGGIALDNYNNSYITGGTSSSDFPNTTGAYDSKYNNGDDVFVLKLNPTGTSLLYSTFMGGKNGNDIAYDITLDTSGNIYVTGETRSNDFPNTTGAFDNIYNGKVDTFVLKLNLSSSSLIYSTFIGGNNNDRGYVIEIDSSGNAYVSGETESPDFPNTTGAFDTTYNGKYDGFVLKLNPTGSALVFSTFIGGKNRDGCIDIEIDFGNNIYVAGGTKSHDFPNTTTAYDNTYNGNWDCFVLQLNSTGSDLMFSTFVGGSNNDSGSLVIDSTGNIYMTGATSSLDFPNTIAAFDTTYNGGNPWCGDAFIFKLNPKLNISIPAVLDLEISKATILRNNSIYLYSNATDTDDLEKNLTPFFEYRDPNEHMWNNTCFSNLRYINSRWEVRFIPLNNAILGLYDFRVMFNDTDMLFTPWFYLNNSLTVLNNIPLIENLSLSKNKAILGDTVSIWIKSTDVEEYEEDLTVDLEYNSPDEQSWNTIYLNNLRFVNKKWQYNFSIPFDAPFGYYDFRARINDSDEDFSQWFYVNNSLLIYNKKPNVIDIELSKNIIYRTDSVFLYVNSTDYETREYALKFYIQYKYNNNNDWANSTGKYSQTNTRWETEFITARESILGLYDFRINFVDNESVSSGWVYLNNSLNVLNNPPVISNNLDNIEVGVSPEFIDLSQYASDIEDSDKDLIWTVDDTKTYNYLESISIINTLNDTLKIVPLMNITGVIDIELSLIDKDGGKTTKSNITIHIDSRINEMTPQVILLFPPDNGVVNTLTPELKWNLNFKVKEKITYSVFLDEIPKPETVMVSNISDTSYILKNELVDGKTYYWKVIPNGGICLSGQFCFKIDLNFTPTYGVNLTAEKKYILINQGSSDKIKLVVKNEGNAIDNFKIGHSSDKLQSQIDIDKTNLQLNPNEKSILCLNFNIPEDFGIGKYPITVIATSLSNETVNDDFTVTVEVIGKNFVQKYKVNLSVFPESIETVENKSIGIILTIINEGNIADNYIIIIISKEFNSTNIQYENNSIYLNPNNKKNVSVNIIVPENFTIGIYKITIIVKSDQAIANTTLIVKVIEKPDGYKPGGKENNLVLFIVIGIIIFIIIFIIILLFLKRKKEPIKEMFTIKTETTKPVPSPTRENGQDKVPVSPLISKNNDIIQTSKNQK